MVGLRAWLGNPWGVWAWLVFAVVLAGCGGEGPDTDDSPDFGDGRFGDACEKTEDCASGLCVRVGQMVGQCSRPCATETDCPIAPNWACVADEAVDVSVCACRAVGSVEVCGDDFDNDCDGLADDCRICDGKAVADNDPRHCRECGNACRADQVCGEEDCECAGETPDECGTVCTDLATDKGHCGECGTVCAPEQLCVQGECACPGTTPDACDSGCVDFDRDPVNCGECGRVCELGLTCLDGECACPDVAEPDYCGVSGCRDLSSDPLFCGECGLACGSGQVCEDGECACPDDGNTHCGDYGCVDTQRDAANCGECGNVCTLATSCYDGECVCPDATSPDFCDGVGCVDLSIDELNCGTCGNECAPNAGCRDGRCECDGGFATCGGDTCVNLSTSEQHCGVCGDSCAAGQTCSFGRCTCDGFGLTTCDDDCADIYADERHCGACDNACATNETCEYGQCYCEGIVCNGVCRRWDDVNNCGGCGNTCAAAQYCDGIGCRCEGSDLSGCGETCADLWSSEQHCGVCGEACRAGEVCSYGSCACPYPQTYCASAGRCVNLTNDTASCGTCGNSCRTGEICSSGTCRCSGTNQIYCASAGTCVSYYSNAEHCGGCDIECNPGETCQFGSCSCPSSQELYCESESACVPVYDNDEHCGDCDNACPAGSSCSQWWCACDDAAATLCSNGCADLLADEQNCGTCGNACAGNQVCNNGKCGCAAPVVGPAVRLTNNLLDDMRPALAWDGTHVGLAYVRYDATTQLGELRFALLNPDGTLVSDANVGGALNAEYWNSNQRPSLVWSGSEYAVTWPAAAMYFLRLDPSGAPKGSPISLSYNSTSALAWSDTYGGYAVGLGGGLAFRRLGLDASTPEASNTFVPLGSVNGTGSVALLARPDGGFTMVYEEYEGVGFAVFNPDGSRTLPVTSVTGSYSGPRYTRWPSIVAHGGDIYASFAGMYAGAILLNRGTQGPATTVMQVPSGQTYRYTDPTLAVVRDSLALAFLELPAGSTTRTARARLVRYSLPATSGYRALHDPVDLDAAQTISSSHTSLVTTSDGAMLAVWSDERWGSTRELYATPIQVGACP